MSSIAPLREGSYFSISRGVLADTVPKAVMHFLVNSVARGLQQHLIQSLYHPNLVPSLLQEHPETESLRLAATAKFNALSVGTAAAACPTQSSHSPTLPLTRLKRDALFLSHYPFLFFNLFNFSIFFEV